MFVASVLLPVTVDNASGGGISNALAIGAGGSGSGGSTALLNLVDFLHTTFSFGSMSVSLPWSKHRCRLQNMDFS